MQDPTEIILTGAFAAAIGIAVVGASWCAAAPTPRPSAELPDDLSAASPADEPSFRTPLPPELLSGGVPVWFYRPLDLLGAAFVFMVFAGLAMASLSMPKDAPAALDPSGLLVSIAFQFIMAGMIAAFVVPRVNPILWLGLRWPSWPWVFLIAPCSVMAMWAVFGGLYRFGYVKWMESLGVETVQETVRLLQESEDPLVLGLMAAAAVIAAPLCEEIVFRGYFYPVLKRFCGIWPAVVSSSLVFACAHGNLAAALPLFLFGGLLVLLYEKTRSIWAPIAVHFCFNGATVVIQFVARHYGIPIDGAS